MTTHTPRFHRPRRDGAADLPQHHAEVRCAHARARATRGSACARGGARRASGVDGRRCRCGRNLVFTCLPGEDQLRDVIFGDGGLAGSMRRGSTLVDLSTAPVDFTRETAEALGRRGIDFADAPIARTRQAAEDGTLSITVGAAPEVFARIEPLLRHAASEVTHCGPVGCGQVVKLMNNMVLVQTIVALSEARAIARRAGVAPALLFEALGKGSADSFALRNHGLKAICPSSSRTAPSRPTMRSKISATRCGWRARRGWRRTARRWRKQRSCARAKPATRRDTGPSCRRSWTAETASEGVARYSGR
jgi:3-hydroxyisobutyrate dehydrogenase-like beta-hydroxyacid dehydrogenase